MEVDLLPPPGVEVESEGMIFKALVRGPVTADGHSLLRPYGESISRITRERFGAGRSIQT
jgi:hypothetical protein